MCVHRTLTHHSQHAHIFRNQLGLCSRLGLRYRVFLGGNHCLVLVQGRPTHQTSRPMWAPRRRGAWPRKSRPDIGHCHKHWNQTNSHQEYRPTVWIASQALRDPEAAEGEYMDPIPRPLGDGEQAHWGIPLDKEQKWINDLFLKDFAKSWLDVQTMVIQVHTTNGGTFSFRPEKALRSMIHSKRMQHNI